MKKMKYLLILSVIILTQQLKAQIEEITVGNTVRQMLVYAPSDIETNRPLLISMHGYNQDINYQKNQAKWELVAKENNFVVVYPGGIDRSWDLSGNRDIDFILTIIDEMYKRYAIDRNRVYLSGFSMGGMMTYYAATKIADKIAAFAPVSGYPMWGVNTNSSRPVPIIHTHGTADDVVSYDGVQNCLDAWIARNNCPTTPVVIDPYPAGNTSSNGVYSYWGPGTDSVEIVLLTLKGVGHWHSNNDNGVHTSKEIWNFCKKFYLGFGVPKYKYSSITDDNPKQIKVIFTLPLKQTDSIAGFSVKVDGIEADIDTVYLTDSVSLAINLTDNITKNNNVTLSYQNGNVESVYNKPLVSFNDTIVDNLLWGSSPRIIDVSTNETGDTILASFNKKMLLPNDISGITLKAVFEGEIDIPVSQFSFYDNDSSVLAFKLDSIVYADYALFFNYSGSNFFSADSGLLLNITDLNINNKSKGLPVHIISGGLESNGIFISLEFSKPMRIKDYQFQQFDLRVNGKVVTIKEVLTQKNNVKFMLSRNLYYGDTIVLNYTPGDVTATDRGELLDITDFAIGNPLGMPTWYAIPGKIEAENYALQYGTDTETTSDVGGGLNVGWTETDDWLVYAIENNTEDTVYQISFRLAAQSSGARYDYYIDDKKIGYVSVPSTGAWQTWRSVVKDIIIPEGQHYFKIVVVTGGFNINYFEIQKNFANITNPLFENLCIYPDPAKDYIVIKSPDFQYNRIEICDISGRRVFYKKLAYQSELFLPLNLKSGKYFVKLLSNEDMFSYPISINQ